MNIVSLMSFVTRFFVKQRAQIMRYSGTANMAAAPLTKLNGPGMLEPVRVGCSVLQEHMLHRECL